MQNVRSWCSKLFELSPTEICLTDSIVHITGEPIFRGTENELMVVAELPKFVDLLLAMQALVPSHLWESGCT